MASSDHLPIVVDLMMVGAQALDTDEDGVLDALDNCVEVPNLTKATSMVTALGTCVKTATPTASWTSWKSTGGRTLRCKTPTATS